MNTTPWFALGLLAAALPAMALEATDITLKDWTLTVVPLAQTVTIDPLGTKAGSATVELKAGTPGWGGPTLLPGPAWTFGALRPETLTAQLADGAKTQLVLGKDFALEPLWGSVAAVKDGAVAPGTKVTFAYQYALSRIDLVEQTKDGKLVVIKGVEDKGTPLLPQGTAGSTPLLSVYLPNHATTLKPEMINRIDPLYDGVPPVSGGEFIQAVKAKIAAGKPVTLVFLGDSITAQQPKDFRDQKGSFVDRFAAFLREAHPDCTVPVIERGQPVPAPKDKQIIIAKAGVGGNDTGMALKRIDADVLAHKPDLVLIMFGVNDENRKGDGNSVPVPAYQANLTTMVTKIRAAGSEVVLMTTSMKNLGWSATVGNLAEYAKAMRAVAAAEKVCLIDHFQAWQDLPKRGYNYMVFLGNCINHPVDLGHDLFCRGLKAAFR